MPRRTCVSNWTGLGALYHILPEVEEEEIEVNNFANLEDWNRVTVLVLPKSISGTVSHLFLTSFTAAKLWTLFANFARKNLVGRQLSLEEEKLY